MKFFVAQGQRQLGPFEPHELAAQGLDPQTLVWREGMAQWQPAASVPDLRHLFGGSVPPPPPVQPQPYYGGGMEYDQSSANTRKIAAGICGILLGAFGVHKFIIGATIPGVIMLLVTLLTFGFGGIVMGVIGIVEGIIYLLKTDQEFYQLYMVGKKGWF